MKPQHLIDNLLGEGIIQEKEKGLRLSDEFRTTIQGLSVENKSSVGNIKPLTTQDGDHESKQTQTLVEKGGQLATIFKHLDSYNSSWSFGEQILMAVIVDQLDREFPKSAGSPKSFFPLLGDQIAPLTALSEYSIVYIWREDCPPCDTVKADLETIFSNRPDDMALFSVCGPKWNKELREQYQVVGAPTILFMVEGRVDARLEGAHLREVIQREIDILKSTS